MKVFVGGLEEIEPVLPSFMTIMLDLTAIDVAEHAFNYTRVIFLELDLGLFALLLRL